MDELLEYEDAVKHFDPVLGLEVHVELATVTKMFDAAPNAFGGEPNTYVTPVSLGMPGALPVVNRRAIEYAIRLGLALNCKIAKSCRFARKNYFYPDLCKNFQTSQSDEPLAYDGYLDVELDDGTVFRVNIERAHVEEDAGKNTHAGFRAQGIRWSITTAQVFRWWKSLPGRSKAPARALPKWLRSMCRQSAILRGPSEFPRPAWNVGMSVRM